MDRPSHAQGKMIAAMTGAFFAFVHVVAFKRDPTTEELVGIEEKMTALIEEAWGGRRLKTGEATWEDFRSLLVLTLKRSLEILEGAK